MEFRLACRRLVRHRTGDRRLLARRRQAGSLRQARVLQPGIPLLVLRRLDTLGGEYKRPLGGGLRSRTIRRTL